MEAKIICLFPEPTGGGGGSRETLILMVTCSPTGGAEPCPRVWRPCPTGVGVRPPDEAGGPQVYLLGFGPAPECWAQTWNWLQSGLQILASG